MKTEPLHPHQYPKPGPRRTLGTNGGPVKIRSAPTDADLQVLLRRVMREPHLRQRERPVTAPAWQVRGIRI